MQCIFNIIFPADTRHWINVVLTLVQRLRGWASVKTTLIERLVSTELYTRINIWINISLHFFVAQMPRETCAQWTRTARRSTHGRPFRASRSSPWRRRSSRPSTWLVLREPDLRTLWEWQRVKSRSVDPDFSVHLNMYTSVMGLRPL